MRPPKRLQCQTDHDEQHALGPQANWAERKVRPPTANQAIKTTAPMGCAGNMEPHLTKGKRYTQQKHIARQIAECQWRCPLQAQRLCNEQRTARPDAHVGRQAQTDKTVAGDHVCAQDHHRYTDQTRVPNKPAFPKEQQRPERRRPGRTTPPNVSTSIDRLALCEKLTSQRPSQ